MRLRSQSKPDAYQNAMTKDYKEEFIDEVARQLIHTKLKREYLKYRLETDIKDESAQNRAKAKMELDALEVKITDLEKFDAWLNPK
jgi:hypothetical protein